MEVPTNNGICIVQLSVYIGLLIITRWHNKAAVVACKSICVGVQDTAGASIIMLITQVIIMLITQVADEINFASDIINLSMPILQAYYHLFASFSPFCKGFEDESYLIKDKRKHYGAVDKRSSKQQ